MKSTVIDSSVLGGQGCIGSKQFAVPSIAPPQGPDAGVDATLSTQVDSPVTTAAASMPTTYPLSGSANEPDSQYDTIDPIPEG